MRQVLRRGFKEIVVTDVPASVVLPHHVLIQPRFSLISAGTETASIKKDGVMREVARNPSHLTKIVEVMKANGPIRTAREVAAKFSDYAVLGYSGAGVVAGKHPSVTDLEIGDHVAYGGEGTGHGECIMTGRNLVARMPDGLGFEAACFATLGAIAMNGVRLSAVGLGDTVAVIGLGLVGQLAAQLARLQGARVIAIDLREDRVALARELGAEAGVSGTDVPDAVLALKEGRGVDCVFLAAASKSSAPCELALTIARDRGAIVVLGAVELAFDWLGMYLKEVRLLMARAYGPGSYDPTYEHGAADYPLAYVRWTENRNMEEFLRLASTGAVRTTDLVTHTFPLEQAPHAYEAIMAPGSTSLAVLLQYDPTSAVSPEDASARRVVLASPRDTGAVRISLAGAANIARWAHIPALRRAGATLRAVQSGNGVRARAYGERFGAAYCTTDYAAVLADRETDAVIITSRNGLHATQTLEALRAGKHVFVEKPMCLTEHECVAIVREARSSGCHVHVGFNRRFAPDYLAVKKALSSRCGPVVLNCRVNSPGIAGAFWMADPTIGGAILGEACHFIDLFAWLLDAEPILVSAFSLPVGVADPIGENNIAASFRFSDGSVGTLTYCTVGSRTSGGEQLEVFLSGLGARTRDFKSFEAARRVRRRKRRWFADKGYDEQMQAFVNAVEGKAIAGGATELDGARATIACLRLMESCRDDGAPKAIDWQRLAPACE